MAVLAIPDSLLPHLTYAWLADSSLQLWDEFEVWIDQISATLVINELSAMIQAGTL